MIRHHASSEFDPTHPVHRVHRVGGAVLGVGLVAFGVAGLLDMPEFFSPSGRPVMGMGSNGALALISVAVGLVLLLAALRGGRASSTTSLVVGGLFLLSGFVHLGILDTTANVLAFRLPNVFFSFAAGVLLLTLGAYGRMSGGLAPGSPYAGPAVAGDAGEDVAPDLVDAEQAAATRRATPAQLALVRADRTQHAAESYDRAWQQYASTHTADEVARLRAASTAESVHGRPAAT